MQKKIFYFFSKKTERKQKTKKTRPSRSPISSLSLSLSLSLSFSVSHNSLSHHALLPDPAGTGAPTTLISQREATRLTKCASAVFVDAWTKKTSRASTGE